MPPILYTQSLPTAAGANACISPGGKRRNAPYPMANMQDLPIPGVDRKVAWYRCPLPLALDPLMAVPVRTRKYLRQWVQ